jgi:hypothetical protein
MGLISQASVLRLLQVGTAPYTAQQVATLLGFPDSASRRRVVTLRLQSLARSGFVTLLGKTHRGTALYQVTTYGRRSQVQEVLAKRRGGLTRLVIIPPSLEEVPS